MTSRLRRTIRAEEQRREVAGLSWVSEDAVESKAESLSNFYCDRKDEKAYSHKIEQEVEGRGTGETLINVAGIVAGIR
jgi:hypothetical protein